MVALADVGSQVSFAVTANCLHIAAVMLSSFFGAL
jgi:hypothetical protein